MEERRSHVRNAWIALYGGIFGVMFEAMYEILTYTIDGRISLGFPINYSSTAITIDGN